VAKLVPDLSTAVWRINSFRRQTTLNAENQYPSVVDIYRNV